MNTKEIVTRFEGSEKKIEIVLKHADKHLRSNETGKWDNVVAVSKAIILGCIKTAEMDAYLLSESSLFVWDDRILIITCGKTSLTDAVPAILEFLPPENIAFFFYERKNLMYPGDQPSNFESDVFALQNYFSGKSYRFGPSGSDHFHLFFYHQEIASDDNEPTLQILMHDVDPELVYSFDFKKNGAPGRNRILGIVDGIHPEWVIDDHLFSPYGYSLNAITDNKYCSVHITPQPEESYASFETNIPVKDYSKIIDPVISAFKPGKYSLVLTSVNNETNMPLHQHLLRECLPGYYAMEKCTYEFYGGYTVSFINNRKKF